MAKLSLMEKREKFSKKLEIFILFWWTWWRISNISHSTNYIAGILNVLV